MAILEGLNVIGGAAPKQKASWQPPEQVVPDWVIRHEDPRVRPPVEESERYKPPTSDLPQYQKLNFPNVKLMGETELRQLAGTLRPLSIPIPHNPEIQRLRDMAMHSRVIKI